MRNKEFGKELARERRERERYLKGESGMTRRNGFGGVGEGKRERSSRGGNRR